MGEHDPISTTQASPRHKALVIGINYDSGLPERLVDWAPISGQTDADRFYLFLRHDRNWDPKDIVLMKDHRDIPHNLWPTRDNLIRELKALVANAQPGDRFVLFFAGHSDQQKSDDPNEEDGEDEVIIPCDIPNSNVNYTEHAIIDNRLREWVVDVLPTGCFLTGVFDTCHSGTLLDLSHYHCNNVYVPWVSRGVRRSRTLFESTIRSNAMSYGARVESLTYRLSGSSTRAGTRCLSDELRPEINALFSVTHQPKPSAESKSRHRGYPGWEVPNSPTLRCMSPDPLPAYKCTGWCQYTKLTQAQVICLSACADRERAWEGEGVTMTSCLLDILRANISNPPSYRHLLTELRGVHPFELPEPSSLITPTTSHNLHKVSREIHSRARAERWEARKNPAEGKRCDLEFDDFQSPQLSSHVPLNMDEPFII